MGYLMYGMGFVMMLVACWHAQEARRHAGIAKIEREAAEQLAKLNSEAMDDLFDRVRQLHGHPPRKPPKGLAS